MNGPSHPSVEQALPPMSEARVLLCNDDGIDAPGFSLLENLAKRLFKEVWVVAPAAEQSAKSRSLSLRTDLKIEQRGGQRFAVWGSPVDCTLVALRGLLPDLPHMLLSGVNAGANLGEDVGYSGTAGCAMEALVNGVPAIALSQSYDERGLRWDHTEALLETVLTALWPYFPLEDLFFNVNFPARYVAANYGKILMTSQGRRLAKASEFRLFKPDFSEGPMTLNLDIKRSERAPIDNCDLSAIARGYVSVTPLGYNQEGKEDRISSLKTFEFPKI